MKKLNIGKVLTDLDGTEKTLVEDDGTRRPLTIKDVIVQLVPTITEFDQKRALMRWEVATQIMKSKKATVELEDAEWNTLKEGLAQAKSPDWVLAHLAMAFKDE